MPATLPRAIYHGLILLCAMLALSACTRLDLAYRNLDVIIPWSLDDYLDLNREQKGWFNDRLAERLNWHCTTQLPNNLALLEKIRQMVADNQVTDERLQALTTEAKAAIAQVAEAVTPSAVELLQGLDDNQVRAMRQAFSEELAERRKTYVEPPLDQQISERARRMEKRLNPWFDKLSDAQKARVMAWSQALGEQNRQRFDNREHWQKLFLAAVEQRDAADFPQRIAQLLQQRERLWTPEYSAVYAHTEQAARDLLVGLAADSTPQQRQQIQEKLTELRQGFAKLKCLNGAT